MFIEQLSAHPQFYFAVVLVVIISTCLHELGHGFAAIALGDRTPEETGHITLNPLVHMGPISLALLFVTGMGWGLMPVDPTRMRGRYADAIVSAAGPAVNVVLALLASTALGLWTRFAGGLDLENHMVSNAVMLLSVMGIYNVLLVILNLLPIPPLDGSRIVGDIVPAYRRFVHEPTMQGVSLALLIGAIMGISRLCGPAITDWFWQYVMLIAGR